MIDIIYEIPTWCLGLATVLSFVIVGVGGFLFTKNWIHDRCRLNRDTNEVVNAFFAGVGVLYGLLMGLVAVANWNNFDDVEEILSKEASAIAVLYSDISAMQEPQRSSMQVHLKSYLHEIVYKEWPMHALGKVPSGWTVLLAELHDEIAKYTPNTKNQKEFLMRSLDSYNQVLELRQRRIDAVEEDRVPEVFWYVILLGGVLSIVMTYFFHVSSSSMHIMMIGLYCTFLGLMVFLVAAVDNPFRGGVSVKPTDYIYMMGQFESSNVTRY